MSKHTATNRHHIIPRSRGGSSLEDNLVTLHKDEHRLYHMLFINRLPEEIINYLNYRFWNNNYSIQITKR